MGIYLNSGNIDFQEALDSEIYVDKTGMIAYTNRVLRTQQKYICVSRPRRFGKSMAANMLTAYYSRGCDSRGIFSGLKIAKAETFEKHLNHYNVIHLNMIDFMSKSDTMNGLIAYLCKRLLHELIREFPDVDYFDKGDFVSVLQDVFADKKVPFVFIIDEWDCVFRQNKGNKEEQKKYLDFLRNLLKDQSYVALAYMTGILPIKKYGEHSALNMFTEVSMTNARGLEEFTGFTEEEVKSLCEKYQMPFEETKRWYDGYDLKGVVIYNPRSVVMSMTGHDYDNYWTSTETYEALKCYIEINCDGLRDIVERLIAGEKIVINPSKFQNDMTTFHSVDDVLTLLVHLGYLTFDFDCKTVRIPNSEVQQEFINSIEDGGWENIMVAIKQSDKLLTATLQSKAETVAEILEQVHQESTSILKYNDENSLSCTISLAYYSARKSYFMIRELPTGKGFADIVFLPRKNNLNPALVIELKCNQSAETAIEQINQKNYADCLKDYTGEILLVGINYDRESKKHTCQMERIAK